MVAATVACWVLFELALRVREAVQGKGGVARDRGTRALVAISVGAAILAAGAAASAASSLRIGGAGRVAGVVVMWLGLAIRASAVATLRGAFRTTVEVDPGQPVASTGPYRWVRHPAYVGLLATVAGFGLAAGDWLSLAACLVVPLPAVVWRIHVEEAELERVLGDAYRAYEARTSRLVPGVW